MTTAFTAMRVIQNGERDRSRDSRGDPGRFQGCVEYFDRHIGALFEAVERLGLAEKTLVIVAVDHGVQGLRCKGALYDHGTEIALMMQMPGTLEKGMRVDHLVQNIDLVPTILQAAGIAVPGTVQGTSLWPALSGGSYQPHREIFTEFSYHVDYQPERSIRTPDFHYIRFFSKNRMRHRTKPEVMALLNSGKRDWLKNWWARVIPSSQTEELYDVRQAPHEWRNLADKPEYAAVKADLRRRLVRWTHDTNDPLLKGPIPEPESD